MIDIGVDIGVDSDTYRLPYKLLLSLGFSSKGVWISYFSDDQFEPYLSSSQNAYLIKCHFL